jgi:DNA polymerase
MLIGQGPGDVETRTGRPFVGPAGQLFEQALVAAGIRRELLWLTNGIKHWATTVNERGNVVNRPPRISEIRACRVWLEGELAIVRPRLILCLGNAAVQALTGQSVKVTLVRGAWFDGPDGVPALATAHPSYLLRLRGADPAAFEAGWATLLADLRLVVERATALGIAVA